MTRTTAVKDLRVVMVDACAEARPAKPLFELLRDRLDPWLGKPKAKTRRNGVQLLYGFDTEVPPVRRMRVKVEVNTREHFSELGFVTLPFAVESPWFSGEAEVTTYALDELLGTKLRALYPRKKGRDVFDLWHAFERGGTSSDPLSSTRSAPRAAQSAWTTKGQERGSPARATTRKTGYERTDPSACGLSMEVTGSKRVSMKPAPASQVSSTSRRKP